MGGQHDSNSAVAEPPHEEGNMLAASAALGGATGKDLKAATALGAVDAVDDRVNRTFDEQGLGDEDSPISKAIWGSAAEAALSLLLTPDLTMSAEAEAVVNQIEATARELLKSGRLFGDNGKISNEAIDELAKAGYLRLLIPAKYGGLGLSIPAALQVQERLAAVHPITALFVSVHGMIGAVNPLRLYGSEEQKERWFPQLALTSSAFALTEPGAGSDVKNLKTRAVLDGDNYRITGHKMFITNAWYDRIMSLVCVVAGPNGKDVTRVFIVRTPKEDNEQFRINKYELHALKNAYNIGMEFTDFLVPAEDMLDADGLEIAFNGLNAARIAVDVNSEVGIQELLTAMLPWSRRRETFHKPIGERPLVETRVAETLALGMATRSIWHFCSAVLQRGFRGEGECVIAKTFGSDAAFHVVSDLYCRTIGGRMLLAGDIGGDSLHDISAERIYEGENSMLLMKLFGTLVKGPQKRYLEPMIANLQKRGIKRINMSNPAHLLALALYGAPQGIDFIKRAAVYGFHALLGHSAIQANLRANGVHHRQLEHATWAIAELQKMSLTLTLAMFKYQTGLINKQNRMIDLSTRAQQLFVMAITAIQASRETDLQLRGAAYLFCEETKRKLAAPGKSDAYYQEADFLGGDLYRNGCTWTRHIDPHHAQIRGEYDNETHKLDTDTVTAGRY